MKRWKKPDTRETIISANHLDFNLWICSWGFCVLTTEKLENSVLFRSRRVPSNAPSSVVKLPREPLPFFRRSGSLGSSHSIVGPAMDREHTAALLEVLRNSPATLRRTLSHPRVCTQPSIHPKKPHKKSSGGWPAALKWNLTPPAIRVSGYSVSTDGRDPHALIGSTFSVCTWQGGLSLYTFTWIGLVTEVSLDSWKIHSNEICCEKVGHGFDISRFKIIAKEKITEHLLMITNSTSWSVAALCSVLPTLCCKDSLTTFFVTKKSRWYRLLQFTFSTAK